MSNRNLAGAAVTLACLLAAPAWGPAQALPGSPPPSAAGQSAANQSVPGEAASGQATPADQQQRADAEAEARWMTLLTEQGPSHASGARPELGATILGNPTQGVVNMRVGLYYSFTATGAFSEFASLQHPFVRVSGTAGIVHVFDGSTGHEILPVAANTIVEVQADGAGYALRLAGGALGTFAGPILFMPENPDARLRVDSLLRTNVLATGTVTPLYRGLLEVSRGASTTAGRVNLVNVLGLEDYVRGVVVNESPAFFHIEALKAQATAARGYAVANIGRYVRLGYPFDVVDSSSSQVYRGATSEHAKSFEAQEGTRGLVASYQGAIITAFYSSSFGGHSDSVEWIFNEPTTQLPGTNVTPYLTAIYDGDPPEPDLSDPAAHALFWKTAQPLTFDECVRVGNRFVRWRLELSPATIKARLTPGRFVPISGDLTGTVASVDVLQRSTGSGRISSVRITLTSGIVEVRGWDNMRRVLGTTQQATPALCGTTTIAANFVLNNPSLIETTNGPDGLLASLTAWGGGWGHNVGFSQYGAHGRGRAGQGFLEILQSYYRGVDIGSYPIDIAYAGAGSATFRQTFSSPTGRAVLEVRPKGLKGLIVHVNGLVDIALRQGDMNREVVRIDLTPYLLPGENTILYNPVGRAGAATVAVLID